MKRAHDNRSNMSPDQSRRGIKKKNNTSTKVHIGPRNATAETQTKYGGTHCDGGFVN
jgi:hypothetical protein